MRTGEIQFECIDSRVLHQLSQFLPTPFVILFHDGSDQNVIGIVFFELTKFFEPLCAVLVAWYLQDVFQVPLRALRGTVLVETGCSSPCSRPRETGYRFAPKSARHQLARTNIPRVSGVPKTAPRETLSRGGSRLQTE